MKLAPGLTFSWRRALGLTDARRALARSIGIPTTRGGIERKIGRVVINAIIREALKK